MERTNVWAKRAHSRDTRDSGDMKSETYPLIENCLPGYVTKSQLIACIITHF